MTRSPLCRIYDHELIVDSFAGGGGASTGIERALGRSPDIAINHDDEAITMHRANHPRTHHLVGNVWDVEPLLVTRGKPVGLLWGSPDCRSFSRCKGGRPLSKRVRALAWVLARWADAVGPRVITCENVVEFRDWGPLLAATRMLGPRELFRGQGFPDSYIIDPEYDGEPLSKTSQIHMCGNSVPPDLAAAIVGANLGGAMEMAA